MSGSSADRSGGAVPWLRVLADAVEVRVRVVPRASRSRVAGTIGDRLKLQVTAAQVDGEANRCVLELVARSAGLPPRSASITAGASGRAKTVRLECENPAAAASELEAAAGSVR